MDHCERDAKRLAEVWRAIQEEDRATRQSRLLSSGRCRRKRHRSEWDESAESPWRENAVRLLEDSTGND